MNIDQLAAAIYPILVSVNARHATITYRDLCEQLPAPWAGAVEPSDELLRKALGRLIEACSQAQLPALSALVVNQQTGIPGPGYFSVRFPTVRSSEERSKCWSKELADVQAANYPPTLQTLR